ncbi:hypothetical protein CAPTEDRAFT_211648 [Capitella teleta]|uniref:Uncharacterized protein n=1 Tax=Capitella teleta TaxID=283909 RepID=R7TD05_CAPTE|nr:hypothetical protein CAPTEDRAFT_211648 [Capitella teleta]|eukprot:ELT91628.1 hypothetical protein CAPTEDRAFT_211648 [Capitella teleta]
MSQLQTAPHTRYSMFPVKENILKIQCCFSYDFITPNHKDRTSLPPAPVYRGKSAPRTSTAHESDSLSSDEEYTDVVVAKVSFITQPNTVSFTAEEKNHLMAMSGLLEKLLTEQIATRRQVEQLTQEVRELKSAQVQLGTECILGKMVFRRQKERKHQKLKESIRGIDQGWNQIDSKFRPIPHPQYLLLTQHRFSGEVLNKRTCLQFAENISNSWKNNGKYSSKLLLQSLTSEIR